MQQVRSGAENRFDIAYLLLNLAAQLFVGAFSHKVRIVLCLVHFLLNFALQLVHAALYFVLGTVLHDVSPPNGILQSSRREGDVLYSAA